MSHIVDQAAKAAIVNAIVAKTSQEVDTPLIVLVDGLVTVFGAEGSRVTRTEVRLGSRVLVVIHKDTNLQAKGVFAAAARFNLLEVKEGERVHTLQIKVDSSTSPYNPIYLFLDGNQIVGQGYGQSMDLRIATDLLGVFVGGPSDHVSQGVINWIRDNISPEP